ncbi:MAG: ABC transporter ATP-binding protein [Erysipelotrichaceae bacterium]|nr:ABC transporter ATP-binding protein [Erysipelotrichaceae bacterium]
MKMLWKYLKPIAGMMFAGLLIKAFGSVLELLLPYILSKIIDDIVPLKDVSQIVLWGGIMVLCSVAAWWCNIRANRNAAEVSRRATQRIRHDLFDKTLYLSCEKTDTFTIPSLETRLTSDTYNVHRMLGMMQRMGIKAPIIVAGGLIITVFMDPFLSLVLLATIPFIAVLVYLRATKGVPLFTKVQKMSDRMISVVRENVQGIRVIKALSRVDYEKNRYERVNNALKDEEIHANRTMAIISPGMNLFLNLGQAGVILAGAYRVAAGLSEPGRIIAFMSYFTIISRNMMAISRMFIMYSRGIASANRIDEVLQTETEKSWESGNYPDGDPQYAIEFRNVSFSYLKVRDNVRHISFRLKPGESIGILGATGAGKSTIMSLLLRFYDVDEGAIYLNGTDVRNIRPSELRKKFGIVMQNDFLFADTIGENIRFGREVSDESMDDAIDSAQAFEFIDQLERKTEHDLTTNGTNVSGGQRQRILLSRAFAGRPSFLLLDDSSSALDYATDAKLRKAINEKYPDTTMMIIAQRVSSIKNCDQILILDNGDISDIGTDEELMQRSSLYASICESQMGGALFE